ncbi:2-amino-4-hydroxy-6-hydroxymethyldihydropteridine diphosphokinase [Aquipuribacter sp. SD81]|uniref:2-amino-4-hydroxy-6- hydroxymethyldihydropteridine diphosphokinase n=1 Tax=Aquipuribacter sp. SD81 TaxID=3127703 RepID=UPI0030170B86
MSEYLDDATGALDRVSVTGIRARGFHGVLPEEKRDGQDFSCDVHLHLARSRAGRSDDLADAVDYSVVARKAYDVLAGPSLDLVEAVAERIAAAVLADERVEAVTVVVHKPQAPVGVPFDDVTVRVVRTRDDAVADAVPDAPLLGVLALGANLGDPYATLHQAVLDLAAVDGLEVLEASPVVDTAPVGGPEQGRYLNAVLLVRTTLSPRALLHACQDVEKAHGRTRRIRWGARTLDVDVVALREADGTPVVVAAPDLDVPHPRAGDRAFVLAPWAAVAPDDRLWWWGEERAVRELLDDLAEDGDEDAVVVREDLALPFRLPTNG